MQNFNFHFSNLHYTPEDVSDFTLLAGGCANINVTLRNKPPIILRIYCRDPGSARKEMGIAELLKSTIPVAKFYVLDELDGHTFAIIECLPGITLRDYLLLHAPSRQQIKNIMQQAGEMLSMISRQTFEQSGFFDKTLSITQPISDDTLQHYGYECLASATVCQVLSSEEIYHIKELFTIYGPLLPGKSDNKLVHGDFDPANILITIQNGDPKISGILDWEFAFAGSPLCDVANMLRYAHHMTPDYQSSFLKGVTHGGYHLPDQWQLTIRLLNIVSLLDSLQRSNTADRPNQVADILEIIRHNVKELKRIDVVPYNASWPTQFANQAKRVKTP